MIEIINIIARAAAQRGWRVLIVGGSVRDMLLGLPPKDIDLEVYGQYTIDDLAMFLSGFGSVDAVGRSFGVFKLRFQKGVDIDVTTPVGKARWAGGIRVSSSLRIPP